MPLLPLLRAEPVDLLQRMQHGKMREPYGRFQTLNIENKVALAKGVMMGVNNVGRLCQGERKDCWIEDVLIYHFKNFIFYF